jgi:hypothetical protein
MRRSISISSPKREEEGPAEPSDLDAQRDPAPAQNAATNAERDDPRPGTHDHVTARQHATPSSTQ